MSNREKIAEALSEGSVDRAKLARRYYALCDLRDATYVEAQPLEAELDTLNVQIQQLQAQAEAKAREIEAVWGPNWITLKREISDLASVLRRIPSRASLEEKPAEAAAAE